MFAAEENELCSQCQEPAGSNQECPQCEARQAEWAEQEYRHTLAVYEQSAQTTGLTNFYA